MTVLKRNWDPYRCHRNFNLVWFYQTKLPWLRSTRPRRWPFDNNAYGDSSSWFARHLLRLHLLLQLEKKQKKKQKREQLKTKTKRWRSGGHSMTFGAWSSAFGARWRWLFAFDWSRRTVVSFVGFVCLLWTRIYIQKAIYNKIIHIVIVIVIVRVIVVTVYQRTLRAAEAATCSHRMNLNFDFNAGFHVVSFRIKRWCSRLPRPRGQQQ